MRKCLTLALGYAGDENTAEQAKAMVEDKEEDPYLRAAAVAAYGTAAGKAAIPDLEAWIHDETAVYGIVHKTEKIFLIADESNRELNRIRARVRAAE